MKKYNTKKTGSPIYWRLVFFIFLLGCSTNNPKQTELAIKWENGQPRILKIPLHLINTNQLDSIKARLVIQLDNSSQPMLGQCRMEGNSILFIPVLPFTRGLNYKVWFGNNLLGQLAIPQEENLQAPQVVAIYPAIDIVPENLLKIHIAFSRPMQEGSASSNIMVIRNGKDTIPSPFLDLEQELWNKEGDMLTVWLDPGRIKRDLQPNLKLGPPLIKGNRYTIFINKQWRDLKGKSLEKEFEWTYTVGNRDDKTPSVDSWVLSNPEAFSKMPLKVWLNEPLDQVLLEKAIHIRSANGQIINGAISVEGEGRILSFTPENAWEPGPYQIEAEARLEDLAGNNLDRLFDQDIMKKNPDSKKNHRKTFIIIE